MKLQKWILWCLLLGFISILILDIAEARKGFRRSFGGRRSTPMRTWSKPKPQKIAPAIPKRPATKGLQQPTQQRKVQQPRSSFGGQRTKAASVPRQRSIASSFGGKRLESGQIYRKRYGVPRKVERVSLPSSAGKQPVQLNYYGGMSDQFMLGYLMGSAPWYWSLPFHPAFYYSRPYIVENPDGSVEVYPGTFSWARLFLVLGGTAFVGFLIWRILRARRQTPSGTSSFSA